MAALTISYLSLSYLLIGFKPEQLFLTVLINSLYFASFKTRKFVSGFSIFILYWVIFDYMKAYPNYSFSNVHIADLYCVEKSLFGISANGTILTPNEYCHLYQNSFLDIISGFFYLMWVPVPLIFAAYLFFQKPVEFYHFALTFLVTNLIGFLVYYLYPAAPPWYVQLNGFTFYASTPGNTAGLARFDHFFGVHVFDALYAKSSNVFAAMPSLHSSYPLLVLYYGIRIGLKNVNLIFLIISAGIWFAAIYTSHHYLLDVIAGIICAGAGIGFFNILLKFTVVKRTIAKLVATNT
ncbi:MAG: inositol phosphorylceramide synthase [Flavipsychrobacter sp.]|nr:inositol phosphorylceramide synthase [Flavipsychrobacter sp.]